MKAFEAATFYLTTNDLLLSLFNTSLFYSWKANKCFHRSFFSFSCHFTGVHFLLSLSPSLISFFTIFHVFSFINLSQCSIELATQTSSYWPSFVRSLTSHEIKIQILILNATKFFLHYGTFFLFFLFFTLPSVI